MKSTMQFQAVRRLAAAVLAIKKDEGLSDKEFHDVVLVISKNADVTTANMYLAVHTSCSICIIARISLLIAGDI